MTFGLLQLTGPYVLATLVLFAGALLLVLRLRPDPYLLARSIAARTSGYIGSAHSSHSCAMAWPHPCVVIDETLLGIAAVSIRANVVMVMVMVFQMTPVHM